eukprot:scaffold17544_cov63-Phaeocystis_antarctica.AAC.4
MLRIFDHTRITVRPKTIRSRQEKRSIPPQRSQRQTLIRTRRRPLRRCSARPPRLRPESNAPAHAMRLHHRCAPAG